MPGDVEIVNLALTKLGANSITSFTDAVKEAREPARIYEMQRDNEVRAHFWRFATARATLPALSTAPEFGYRTAYQLPVDCLRVIAVGDFAPGNSRWLYITGTDNEEYQVEGNTIVTDNGISSGQSPPLRIRYSKRVTDATMFDACFVEALACKLAIELANALTSATQADLQKFQLGYQKAISDALRVNALEQPPAYETSSPWMLARLPG